MPVASLSIPIAVSPVFDPARLQRKLVRTEGLEPSRRRRLGILSPVCLPVPPRPPVAPLMRNVELVRNNFALGSIAEGIGLRQPAAKDTRAIRRRHGFGRYAGQPRLYWLSDFGSVISGGFMKAGVDRANRPGKYRTWRGSRGRK